MSARQRASGGGDGWRAARARTETVRPPSSPLRRLPTSVSVPRAAFDPATRRRKVRLTVPETVTPGTDCVVTQDQPALATSHEPPRRPPPELARAAGEHQPEVVDRRRDRAHGPPDLRRQARVAAQRLEAGGRGLHRGHAGRQARAGRRRPAVTREVGDGVDRAGAGRPSSARRRGSRAGSRPGCAAGSAPTTRVACGGPPRPAGSASGRSGTAARASPRRGAGRPASAGRGRSRPRSTTPASKGANAPAGSAAIRCWTTAGRWSSGVPTSHGTGLVSHVVA